MEKCREVTQGYSTKEECDKWPQQVCELEKKVVKKYSPETQVETNRKHIISFSNAIFLALLLVYNSHKGLTIPL